MVSIGLVTHQYHVVLCIQPFFLCIIQSEKRWSFWKLWHPVYHSSPVEAWINEFQDNIYYHNHLYITALSDNMKLSANPSYNWDCTLCPCILYLSNIYHLYSTSINIWNKYRACTACFRPSFTLLLFYWTIVRKGSLKKKHFFPQKGDTGLGFLGLGYQAQM